MQGDRSPTRLRTPPLRSALYGLLAASSTLWCFFSVAEGPQRSPAFPFPASVPLSESFRQPFPAVSGPRLDTFFKGSHIFKVDWNPLAEIDQPFDGLGPLFSRSSCLGCHPGNGRGQLPPPTDSTLSLVVRLQPGGGASSSAASYGEQIDYQAVRGVLPEGRARVSYEKVARTFADGTPYELRRPSYSFENLRFGELGADTLISPRLPPGVYGLGLLEAVPEREILRRADPRDRDRNGISGRASWLEEKGSRGKKLGRFGWKAERPSLRAQVAAALSRDIGITSSVFPAATCSSSEADCRQARSLEKAEIGDELLEAMVFYMQLLAPPERPWRRDPRAVAGFEIFRRVGCGDCHRPSMRTAAEPAHPELANRSFEAYTDLLLHDMGPELADGIPGHRRTLEWRTPPLWGIGLGQAMHGSSYFLHDGRARTILEAILWHGGEAAGSRKQVERLTAAERDALVAFVGSI